MADEPKKEKDKVWMVYVGTYFDQKRKRFQEWVSLGKDASEWYVVVLAFAEQRSGSRIYDPKGMPKALPGQIYSYDSDIGEGDRLQIYPKSATYVGLLQVHDEKLRQVVVEWQAKNMSAVNAMEAVKLSEKEGDLIADCMDPLRKAYQKMSPFQQAAFTVAIVAEMRAWKKGGK